ncbi:putative 5'-3' exonuclease protein [Rhizobium phage RHph_N37]|uniref:Putative 5'-3' exonuclease protein n=1 Tax=Rhizobium phage RHph_N37 TaxID=2509749 RepID=A0A7S5R8N7_9CAUD|nr:putative 5'-3' exonuclease protein [Rhizobium phage RHph_N37]
MIINGIDLSALTPQMKAENFPETVPGRVVHIDADFLAYMVSYEREGQQIALDDMYHNTKVAVEKMRRMAAAQFVHLHLTPSTSTKGGRNELAIQKEYQGNRQDKPKPAKLHIMRDWMGRNFPSTLHQLCEADDGMSSMQYAALAAGTGNLSIICTKDKDLNMVPGLHLDWDTGELGQAEDEIGHASSYGTIWLDHAKSAKKIKGYGQKFFWAQMLMGDTADNIAGLLKHCSPHLSKPKSIGPVHADYLLMDARNNREAFALVKGLYEAYGRDIGFVNYRDGTSVPWQNVFMSEAKLLWMRREPHNPDCVLNFFKEVLNG